MAKAKTGPCEPYSDADLAALGHHIAGVVQNTGEAPTSIRAQVEYHGTIARSGNGVRTFTLDQLTDRQQDRIVAAAEAAGEALAAAHAARPLSTYNRKGWLARFKQLAGTNRGRAAMQKAGVTGTVETQQRWLSETQKAGRDNQAAIARAYNEIRMSRVDAANDRADEAIIEVAEDFDEIMAEAYGANGVRFRDIEG